MIQDWCQKSGMKNWPNQQNWNKQNSNDKPAFNYGIPFVDDGSIRRAIMSVAPLFPRNYVVMEVQHNLDAADRDVNIKRFNFPHFKKIAYVVMGEPDTDFKLQVHEKLLQEKQVKVDAEWKQKKILADRKKAEKARKKAADER